MRPRLRLNQEETIAGCSINMHNDFFTKQWGIKNGEKYYESLCLGFGIERWCYAILSEDELACKGEAEGYTYYVMNTIYCVFAFSKLKT